MVWNFMDELAESTQQWLTKNHDTVHEVLSTETPTALLHGLASDAELVHHLGTILDALELKSALEGAERQAARLNVLSRTLTYAASRRNEESTDRFYWTCMQARMFIDEHLSVHPDGKELPNFLRRSAAVAHQGGLSLEAALIVDFGLRKWWTLFDVTESTSHKQEALAELGTLPDDCAYLWCSLEEYAAAALIIEQWKFRSADAWPLVVDSFTYSHGESYPNAVRALRRVAQASRRADLNERREWITEELRARTGCPADLGDISRAFGPTAAEENRRDSSSNSDCASVGAEDSRTAKRLTMNSDIADNGILRSLDGCAYLFGGSLGLGVVVVRHLRDRIVYTGHLLDGDTSSEIISTLHEPGGSGYLRASAVGARPDMRVALGGLLSSKIGRLATFLTNCFREEPVGAHVVVVASGVLVTLPVHALKSDDDRWVHEILSVTYAPSLRTLNMAAELAHRRTRVLKNANLLAIGEVGGGSSLPYGPCELAVAAMSAGESHSIILSREVDVRRVNGRSPLIFSIVHIAAHMQAHIDRRFPASIEFESWSLPLGNLMGSMPVSWGTARLAIASGCRSAAFDLDNPMREATSVTNSLYLEGIPAVIGTLWLADDRASCCLLARFYKNIDLIPGDWNLDNLIIRRSLHEAQDWLRSCSAAKLADYLTEYPELGTWGYSEKVRLKGFLRPLVEFLSGLPPQRRPFADPYFWAPFTMTGY